MPIITTDTLTDGVTVYVFAYVGTNIKAQGVTESEARASYHTAIIDYVNSCIADGVNVPDGVMREYNRLTGA